jgi:hypothetical protein
VIAPEASAEFVAHMERVLDVYKRPLDTKHPVVCMDETPPRANMTCCTYPREFSEQRGR